MNADKLRWKREHLRVDSLKIFCIVWNNGK